MPDSGMMTEVAGSESKFEEARMSELSLMIEVRHSKLNFMI